jgi:hypothetical protein
MDRPRVTPTHGANNPTSQTPTQPTSTNTARPRDTSNSHNNNAAKKLDCTHTAARTPRTTQHRAPGIPHTANRQTDRHTHTHTQSHTRSQCHTHIRAAKLPSVDGMLPESWLLYKSSCLHDTRIANASLAHHHTQCRCRPQSATRNTSQFIA